MRNACPRRPWRMFWAGPFGPLRLPSSGRASVVAEVRWETLTRFAAATNPPKKFPNGGAAAAQGLDALTNLLKNSNIKEALDSGNNTDIANQLRLDLHDADHIKIIQQLRAD